MNYPFGRHGFTIVELLIVVVVIAILASITVVSYSGITTQTKNTQTVAAASDYATMLVAYNIKNNSWPITTNTCIGVTPCGRISGSGADLCDLGQGPVSATEPLTSLLLSSSGAVSISSPSNQTVQCASGEFKGVWYWGDANQRRLTYYLAGDQDCPRLAGTTSNTKRSSGNATACVSQFGP